MHLLGHFFTLIYLLLPPTAGALAIRASRRTGKRAPLGTFAVLVGCAVLIGIAGTLLFAHLADATASIGQIAVTIYVAMGMLVVLAGWHRLMKHTLLRLGRVSVPFAQRGNAWVIRATAALFTHVMLVAVFSFCYVISVGMVYRPRLAVITNPVARFGFQYEAAHFDSTDGVRLDGWWIPAAAARSNSAATPAESTRTVIVCHGLGMNKANALDLARDLVPNGYNVLAFDLRAHGASGGNVSTAGDRERDDVLGAIRWVRATHPAQSQKVFGVGADIGGVALIAAAADDGPEGQAIDALAVYGVYDDLGSLTWNMCRDNVGPVLGSLIRYGAMPLAGLQAGADLARFRPAALVDKFAPRPLLVIHGRGDTLVPFDHGSRLFEAASQPKVRFWIGASEPHGNVEAPVDPHAERGAVLHSEDASRAVRLFFDWSQSVL